MKEGVKLRWGQLAVLGLFVLLLYALIPRLDSFKDSWQVIGQANAGWMVGALVVSSLTYVAAAVIYALLALKPLQLWRTVAVQVAATFANRLLPAGAGSMGVNYLYLRKRQHTRAQAGAVVVINGVVGFLGNMLLLSYFVLTGKVKSPSLHLPQLSGWWWLVAAVVVLGLILVLILGRRRLSYAFASFGRALRAYQKRPGRLLLSVLAAMALAILYSACLMACARAVGVDLSFSALFLVMSVGVAGATITPTPGGLGGAETALVAGMLVYGVAGASALAAVLLYRLCMYWLPLIVGGGVFALSRSRHWI